MRAKRALNQANEDFHGHPPECIRELMRHVSFWKNWLFLYLPFRPLFAFSVTLGFGECRRHCSPSFCYRFHWSQSQRALVTFCSCVRTWIVLHHLCWLATRPGFCRRKCIGDKRCRVQFRRRPSRPELRKKAESKRELGTYWSDSSEPPSVCFPNEVRVVENHES